MKTVACQCGSVRLELDDLDILGSVLCGCSECRLVNTILHGLGGPVVTSCLRAVYLKAGHFRIVETSSEPCARRLRLSARSTTLRLFCARCRSVIAMRHSMYAESVFALPVDLVRSDFEIDCSPQAYVGMIDFDQDFGLIDDALPLFHSFRYQQELRRFLSIARFSEIVSLHPHGSRHPIDDELNRLPVMDLDHGLQEHELVQPSCLG